MRGGLFLYFFQVGVFLGGVCGTEISSGGGSFLEEDDLIFFFEDVGGHPCWGEIGPLWPSRLTGRPYMMDWVEEKKGGVDMKKTNEEKKNGKKT